MFSLLKSVGFNDAAETQCFREPPFIYRGPTYSDNKLSSYCYRFLFTWI